MAVTCDTNGWVFFWRTQYPLGLYVANADVQAVFWQDATHLLLADRGGARGRPYIYHLNLEGPVWEEIDQGVTVL